MGSIKVVKGDLFESGAQTLVNTVNCVGVMGKGIALQAKKRFPAMYEDYVRRCDTGDVQLGSPYLWKPLVPPWVLNFPTKDHWRSVAKLDDIIEGLDYLALHHVEWGIESLAVPPLGCGEGKLDWSIVGPTLYRMLSKLDAEVELYAPFNVKDSQLSTEYLGTEQLSDKSGGVRGLDTAGVALAVVLRLVEREPYRWPIGRVAFQKLAYFATEVGIPTGLSFTQGSYGPFASDLKRLQTRLVNNGLITERRLGRMFEVHTGPTYKDAVERHADKLEEWRPEIERVADLLLRADTKQAEVFASAHFAADLLTRQTDTELSEQDVVDEVLRWKVRRKPSLDESEIASAVRTLNVLGWIRTSPTTDLKHEPDFAELVG